ncbi:hypothetical protein HPB49_001538 [Dermacentor silvarum]|uniref:Uncharacterized protein n=1 Tax=Dermacentor silvarum TaxID=543639 RepID=A0ACB8CUX9_DERSI|nr:hypothetical protein HPB49_001538 [Dermacentor silvarum]
MQPTSHAGGSLPSVGERTRAANATEAGREEARQAAERESKQVLGSRVQRGDHRQAPDTFAANIDNSHLQPLSRRRVCYAECRSSLGGVAWQVCYGRSGGGNGVQPTQLRRTPPPLPWSLPGEHALKPRRTVSYRQGVERFWAAHTSATDPSRNRRACNGVLEVNFDSCVIFPSKAALLWDARRNGAEEKTGGGGGVRNVGRICPKRAAIALWRDWRGSCDFLVQRAGGRGRPIVDDGLPGFRVWDIREPLEEPLCGAIVPFVSSTVTASRLRVKVEASTKTGCASRLSNVWDTGPSVADRTRVQTSGRPRWRPGFAMGSHPDSLEQERKKAAEHAARLVQVATGTIQRKDDPDEAPGLEFESSESAEEATVVRVQGKDSSLHSPEQGAAMVPYSRATSDATAVPSSSWPTVLASGWLFFFASALFRSYGLLYLHLVRTVQLSRAAASLPIAFVAAAAGVSGLLCTLLHKRVPVIVSNLCCCLVCGAALCFPYIMATSPGLALAGIFYDVSRA